MSSSRASLFVNHLARNAMSCIIRTLLQVAVMASSAGPDAGPPIQCGVTRFVCVNCSKTGKLSSRGLFLNRAGVRRHISATKACFAAELGFREIRVDARSGDVMAGLGGAAGPAPDVRHQISIPVFSRRYDSFLTPIEIAPFRSSDPTPSSRSDLRYVPTL